MNPISQSGHGGLSLSQSSPISLNRKDRLLVISGLVCALLALSFCFIMSAATHPALIVITVMCALLAVLIASVVSIRSMCRLFVVDKPIPKGFLKVIHDSYPQEIYMCCVERGLTIQELRQVLDAVEREDISRMSTSLIGKLGISELNRLIVACRQQSLPSLDALLIQSCPLYFYRAFVQSGSRDVPESEGLLPFVYWLGNAGLGDRGSVFDVVSWLFVNVTTNEEYRVLRDQAKSCSWQRDSELLQDIEQRMEEKLAQLEELSEVQKREVRHSMMVMSSKILGLCHHDMSVEQLDLLRNACVLNMHFMSGYESSSRANVNLVRTFFGLRSYIEEEEEKYDPYVALLTWEEYKEGVSAYYLPGECDHVMALKKWLEGRSRRLGVLHIPSLEDLSGYLIFCGMDTATGRREAFF